MGVGGWGGCQTFRKHVFLKGKHDMFFKGDFILKHMAKIQDRLLKQFLCLSMNWKQQHPLEGFVYVSRLVFCHWLVFICCPREDEKPSLVFLRLCILKALSHECRMRNKWRLTIKIRMTLTKEEKNTYKQSTLPNERPFKGSNGHETDINGCQKMPFVSHRPT